MKKEKIWRCDLKEPCIKACESENDKHLCGIYLKDKKRKIMIDLHKGDFITVTRHPYSERDRSFFGEPLEILAIQDNFLSVYKIRDRDMFAFVIDTNETNVIKISDEYALSFIKHKKVKRSFFDFLKFWEN